MKNKFLRIITTIMLLILAMTFASCIKDPVTPNDTADITSGSTDEESVTSSESGATDPDDVIDYIIKDGIAQYKLIRGEDAEIFERTYANTIYKRYSEYDKNAQFSDDFVSRNDTIDPNAKEILFGHTNRPETAEVLSQLKYRDYAVVKKGSKIVITSHSQEGLQMATNYFINRILYETKQGEEGYELIMPDGYIHHANYTSENIKVGNTDLKDFRIVYASDNKELFKQAAYGWQDVIAYACGYVLPVVSDSEPETEHEILLGNTNRAQSRSAYSDKSVYDMLMKASVSIDGGKIVVIGGGSYSTSFISSEFCNKSIAGKDISLDNGNLISIDLMKGKEAPSAEGTDVRIMSANILAEFASWATDETEKPITPRAEIFLACLEFYGPDAIGVQEVTPQWVTYLDIYFAMSGRYKIFGTKRTDNGDNYSSVIYDQQKFDLEAQGFKQYSRHSSAVCRNMQWGIFKNKENGQRFALVSTHWDFGNEENKVEMRAVQLKELSKLVAELSSTYSCPVMTTGDYNCSETSQSYKDFMAINNMQDSKFAAKTRYNFYGSCHTLGMSDYSTGSIDCVFATHDTEVLGYMTVVDNEVIMLSDHFPVFADIKFKK